MIVQKLDFPDARLPQAGRHQVQGLQRLPTAIDIVAQIDDHPALGTRARRIGPARILQDRLAQVAEQVYATVAIANRIHPGAGWDGCFGADPPEAACERREGHDGVLRRVAVLGECRAILANNRGRFRLNEHRAKATKRSEFCVV